MFSMTHVAGVYLVSVAVHVLIPTKRSIGYCCDFNGRPLQYRLNAFFTILVVDMIYLVCFKYQLYSATFFAINFWNSWLSGMSIGTLLAVLYSVKAYLNPPADSKYLRCLTVDMTKVDSNGKIIIVNKPVLDPKYGMKSTLIDFYNGYEFNPRFLNIDVKMMLYSSGACLLHLNIISMLFLSIEKHGFLSNAMLLYFLQFSWFLLEYCFFERVHLYTYDLFAEKIGWKLLFGCLGFYPFLYCIGGIVLSNFQSDDISLAQLICFLLMYFVGWVLTRGPNLQKYYFKIDPSSKSCFWGLVKQETIENSSLLNSGFWALSRHISILL
jgi:delta14-sterol reductase